MKDFKKASTNDIEVPEKNEQPVFNRSVAGNPTVDRYGTGITKNNFLFRKSVKTYTFTPDSSFSDYGTVTFKHKLGYRPMVIGFFTSQFDVTKQIGPNAGSIMWVHNVTTNEIVLGYNNMVAGTHEVEIHFLENESI